MVFSSLNLPIPSDFDLPDDNEHVTDAIPPRQSRWRATVEEVPDEPTRGILSP
jgi:hypothetical protein